MASGTKIVFFGNERIATGVKTDTPVLKALIENDYNVVAVVTNYETGTSRSSRDLEIAKIAKQHGIPVLIPAKLTDIKQQLTDYKAEVGVLVAYGKLVPQEIIDVFPKGIVNIHPSLLPKHRGPTPVETAILDGDTKTGVSLMMLVKEMDAGPVLVQRTIHLKGDESKQILADNLLQLGKELLIENLPKYITGDIKPYNQPHPDRATYSRKLTKIDGTIDWAKPAVVIEREIRAFLGWPQSRTKIGSTEVIITKAYATPTENQDSKPINEVKDIKPIKSLSIATNSGTLWIQTLKPAGKPEMSIESFLAGYKIQN